ncbi:hypothetical protein HYV81_05465 [Candidatus Woesearchaeota archaeon]|nr:hypothetical protein [Candidatus Woesearchaeota archaeon]
MNDKKLADMIMEKGIDNVNLTMLTPEKRRNILSHVAEKYAKKNNIPEAVRLFAMAENREKLVELSDWLMEQRRYKQAAQAIIPTDDKERQNRIAEICLRERLFETASNVYTTMGNTVMAKFISENFPVEDFES